MEAVGLYLFILFCSLLGFSQKNLEKRACAWGLSPSHWQDLCPDLSVPFTVVSGLDGTQRRCGSS